MHSRSGRYTIVFNGEIYNFLELRDEIGGIWRGRSDTEVLLEAIERWGFENAVKRLNGMFAMAVWDRETRSLSFARDPFGKKPLHYGWAGNVLLFGSELKALRAHPAFEGRIDRMSMESFLRFAYIPAPRTIYAGFHKLPAGCTLRVASPLPDASLKPIPFWEARAVAASSARNGFPGSFSEAASQLEGLLIDATRRRCIADVPLGAFLSGGIDSSLTVALMQRESATPVRSFTIGFEEEAFNEAPQAKLIAHHLGTEHTEMYVSSSEAREVIPSLPEIYDEPFADPSQIPTYLLAKLTRRHVTVALSGDGGDEVFAGYERYRIGDVLQARLSWLPAVLRAPMAWCCARFPARAWNHLVEGTLGPRFSCGRLRKLGRSLENAGNPLLYRELMAYWNEIPELVQDAGSDDPEIWKGSGIPAGFHPVHQMMLTDTQTYLVDDILVKVDRASMASSLEVRNPLLDTRVFEFAWSLPLAYKYSRSGGKRILREVLSRYVPPALTERPKMGFGIPLDAWMRGPLRDWAEEMLSIQRLRSSGLHVEPIRAGWEAFVKRGEALQYPLWNVIVLQQWLGSNGDA